MGCCFLHYWQLNVINNHHVHMPRISQQIGNASRLSEPKGIRRDTWNRSCSSAIYKFVRQHMPDLWTRTRLWKSFSNTNRLQIPSVCIHVFPNDLRHPKLTYRSTRILPYFQTIRKLYQPWNPFLAIYGYCTVTYFLKHCPVQSINVLL